MVNEIIGNQHDIICSPDLERLDFGHLEFDHSLILSFGEFDVWAVLITTAFFLQYDHPMYMLNPKNSGPDPINLTLQPRLENTTQWNILEGMGESIYKLSTTVNAHTRVSASEQAKLSQDLKDNRLLLRLSEIVDRYDPERDGDVLICPNIYVSEVN